MDVAVLGIGNIGLFHVREYLNNNCNVVAILESNETLAKEKKDLIKKEYNIDVKTYTDLFELLSNEKLDTISICTPPDKHYEQVKICLENNLNVLCEKPFVIGKNNLKLAKDLFILAKERKKILSVNTQWPSALEQIKSLISSKPIQEFSFYMEPGLKDIGLLTEALPHANSLLIKLLGIGEIKNPKFIKKESNEVILDFDYIYCNLICNVKYHFKFKQDRPREVSFSINNNKFTRIFKNNNQVLINKDNEIPIEDPFKISLKRFIGAINMNNPPLVEEKEILENLLLQNIILSSYLI
ncbi:MAG: Gfo/Idh/MocA family oxidoreductase [Candidatus Pacearchaeota archaeon]|jgi:hypothetical protein